VPTTSTELRGSQCGTDWIIRSTDIWRRTDCYICTTNLPDQLHTATLRILTCVHPDGCSRLLRKAGIYTVGYATTNECHNEQFFSMKSGWYNQHRCYNECGGIQSAEAVRACAYTASYSSRLQYSSVSRSVDTPSQAKVLTGCGDVPLSVSHSCFWPHCWAQ